MTDQHRWDALGCAGNSKIRTPNLDGLASSGVHFSNACTSTPVCVAARMSLITGQRSSRTHWVTNRCLSGPLSELPTMMGLLMREGYWTQGIGKMHFRGRHYGLRDLVTMEECAEHITDDDYLMYLRRKGVRNRYPMGLRDLLYYQPQTNGLHFELSMNNYVGDLSVEFLRSHIRYRGERPFFLWSSCTSPHPPFAPCEPYDSMYDPDEMDLPVNVDRPLSDIPSFLWGNRGRLDGAHRDPDRIRRIRALYYGLVSHVDDVFGRIIEEVKALGLWEDTVILFVSDHGDMLGDHGLSQKSCPYEPSVRIPMILRWPGRTEPGRVCDDLVGLTDILPTLIKELDLPYPDRGNLAGNSLLGIDGGGLSVERDAYVIDYGVDRQRWLAFRTRSHMFCLFVDGNKRELYDLEQDPWEIDNVIEDQAKLADEFTKRALSWERENGLPSSFVDGEFRVFATPDRIPSEEECRIVSLNEGAWPKRLPDCEKDSVETYAEAFTRAISKETTISPDKLSLRQYKEKYLKLSPTDPGGESLVGTPWEYAWNRIGV